VLPAPLRAADSLRSKQSPKWKIQQSKKRKSTKSVYHQWG
jgi:hypothetical protein